MTAERSRRSAQKTNYTATSDCQLAISLYYFRMRQQLQSREKDLRFQGTIIPLNCKWVSATQLRLHGSSSNLAAGFLRYAWLMVQSTRLKMLPRSARLLLFHRSAQLKTTQSKPNRTVVLRLQLPVTVTVTDHPANEGKYKAYRLPVLSKSSNSSLLSISCSTQPFKNPISN